MRFFGCIAVLFLLPCLGHQLNGQNVLELDGQFPVHELNQYLLLCEDPAAAYTADRIRADSGICAHPYEEWKNICDRSRIYWGKLLMHPTDTIADWFLQFEDYDFSRSGWGRGHGKIDVFVYQHDTLLYHKKTGADYAKKLKDVKPWWNVNRVNLRLKPNVISEIIFRVERKQFVSQPPLHVLLRKPGFQNYFPLFNRVTFFKKFLLGVVFIMFLYHSLLFMYLTQRVYLWYSIWLFFSMISLLMVVDVGLLSETILANIPEARLPFWSFSANCVWFTFWFFGRSFANTKEKYPILDRLILSLISIILLELVISLCHLLWASNEAVAFNLSLHYFLLSIFTLVGFFIAVALSLKKDELARYFGVGAMVATLAPMIGGLWTNGIISLPFDPFVWGIFLVIIAYSFGLAYRQQLKAVAYSKAQIDLLNAEKAKIELKRVKDLDDIKSKFFANVSHEFRTPLTLISGILSRAKSSKDRNEEPIKLSNKSMITLDRNVTRLEYLVDQLLELSKLESGHVNLKYEQGGFVAFVRSLVGGFESMAINYNIAYQTSFLPEIEDAYFDKDKLEKILSNLLSNAFKYSNKNGSVFFSMSRDGDFIEFLIRDTGDGMLPEEVSRIFERFYRVEGTEAVGSGIGLALTKELVTILNGALHVESQLGEGTTFKVKLPISKEKLPEILLDKAELKPKFTGYQNLQASQNRNLVSKDESPVVLIVEDNQDLQLFINESLQERYSVLTADDGEKGLELALRHIPTIIISDVMMPLMNGFELCRKIKTDTRTSHIPVILLTAKVGQESKMEGLGVGADAYLRKPFKEDELHLRVENFIVANQKIWEHFKSVDSLDTRSSDWSALDDEFFKRVIEIIDESMVDESFSVEILARKTGFSRSQLHRKLKALTNKSANQIIREKRLAVAKKLLENRRGNVSEIAYQVGYSNLSYFSRSFKELFGVLPSEI